MADGQLKLSRHETVMPRIEFSKKTRTQAWRRAAGRCECCGAKLFDGDGHAFDHITAVEVSQDASLENCQVLCRTCHKLKTGKHDIPMIAKSNRQRNKAAGIKKSGRPMPGSRNSDWKKTFNNGWVKRS